ncbi:23S rRNA (guanosine-2'-O-)-methyltransferase RlmB [bacterium BMS3Abin10]|nr:23S rRNA (guanosine-2'-O-)-methyltransferase RlmB [bacterium BMS3Abin10]GBE39384.1 23S rRNA (guanosine-2'-O-)-methyltransferase RlmB [bacterium BMS3Bbin08]HDK17292.1 RNA methyltransferase [Nitrospirota bacterium]
MAKNTMFLYGKNSVQERLKADPESIRRVFVQRNFKAPDIIKTIRSLNIPVESVTEKELLRIKRADRLQGIVAEVNKFAYTPFGELVDSRLSPVFLDSINDPQNLGSIIRILACFGGFAVVIPKHGACEVNDTVIHVASGGENHVPVALVTNLSSALREAKTAGYWAVGTVVDGGEDINTASLPFPMCLVMGSEGKGIRPGLQKLLDLKVTLLMKGAQLSLNVAMACAVFAYEIDRQRTG